MNTLRRGLPLIAVIFAATGCSDSTGPRGGERLGVILFHGDPIVIEIPDTVRVGVPFDASVMTYGGGCLNAWRKSASLGQRCPSTPC